ncbi:universal stress protein [Mycolicibacterium holsaticum]|uniref:Universal stress protein n=1 Tax=Mycolicibacterium holsaticum TaxID=152142 RepID=A0A1E3RVG9_9MYCO|nr:universal stress protein [Mycolicibacterium holsaticum]ODQ93849.1 universal stress protein [Mycolicibacterium holsaticum]
MPTTRRHDGIVVGVDGSPPSKAAVEWAAREAGMRNLGVSIIHVIQSPAVQMWPEVPTPPDLTRQLEQEGQVILRDAREIAQAAVKDAPVGVETEMVVAGVLSTLIDVSKEAKMVVVGCRGLGVLGRRLLGSVSAGLIRYAGCPVAVIHDEDAPTPQLATAPVVVGIDGSPASELATAIAFDAASHRGVHLVAVHAWSDFGVAELPGIEWSDVQVQAEEALAERLAGWQERYPDVTVERLVVLDRPARQLLAQAEKAQLTVVGSHGRGGFARMLLGSVSTAVAESARTPVVVARAS